MRIVIAAIVFGLFLTATNAAELEGDYLFKVTTVRAAPGGFSGLLEGIQALKASGHFADAGEPAPLVMRHSQGDQWDLLVITPMASWSEFYDAAAVKRREDARQSQAALIARLSTLVAFSEDHFAYGPPFPLVKQAFDENNFFHIEMFAAAPGKAKQLMQQRRMENAYLDATGQIRNMIFHRAGGSDVDVFTIGFHRSLLAFAQPADVSDEEKEIAAKSAGFKELSDISFYLRSLITAHHDTLAVKVD